MVHEKILEAFRQKKRLSKFFNGEGNGTHSSTLAWKIPWMEEPGRLQSMGRTESDMTEVTSLHLTKNKIQGLLLQTPLFLLMRTHVAAVLNIG